MQVKLTVTITSHDVVPHRTTTWVFESDIQYPYETVQTVEEIKKMVKEVGIDRQGEREGR